MGYSFYSSYTNDYISQVEEITSLLESCILSKFDNIREQSKKTSMEVLDASMNQPATEHSDPSDLVEEAIDAGVSTYQALSSLRQGMINFFAAAIYQCWTQQLAEFHDTNPQRFSLLRVCHQKDVGAWNDIHGELRLVANTAKHGESSGKLRKIRPDLFRPPGGKLASFDPLFGNELYVSIQDVRHYRDLIVNFWREYTEILDRKEAAFGIGERSPDV